MLDDVLLVNSVLCMIADHNLVFGRCRNKEPHSSGILLCRVVVVGYENCIYVCHCIAGNASDLSYPLNFCPAADRCGFSDLLGTFRMHFIFVREPPCANYMKVKCIRNHVDLA